MNRNRIRLVLTTMMSFGLLWFVAAADAVDDSSKLLVTPDWLAEQIKSNPKLRVLDLAFRKSNYEKGHIPQAQFLNWRSDIIDSEKPELYRLPKQSQLEELMSQMGIANDSLVVLTDDMANRAAIRMYYTLKYFGHKDVRILNGGTSQWRSAKRALTKKVPELKSTQYKVTKTNDDYVMLIENVKAAIADKKTQIIDGRPTAQFTGQQPGKAIHNNRQHKRIGRIPGAINIPWKENFNSDNTLKSLDELRTLYMSHGIDVDGRVVTYCNEGLHAAIPWFILHELLGNTDTHVYDDSMAQWANRSDTPMEKAK